MYFNLVHVQSVCFAVRPTAELAIDMFNLRGAIAAIISSRVTTVPTAPKREIPTELCMGVLVMLYNVLLAVEKSHVGRQCACKVEKLSREYEFSGSTAWIEHSSGYFGTSDMRALHDRPCTSTRSTFFSLDCAVRPSAELEHDTLDLRGAITAIDSSNVVTKLLKRDEKYQPNHAWTC